MASRVRAHFAESAILDAAIPVFARHGLAATRVEDLCAAAKISRRTFYKYFRGKEEVLAGLYDVVTEKLADPFRQGDARAAIDAWLDFHAVNRTLLRLLVEEAMRSGSLLHRRRGWLRGEVSRGLARAAGKKTDPMVFQALLALLEGLSLHLLERNAGRAEIDRARRIVHAAADHLLGRR